MEMNKLFSSGVTLSGGHWAHRRFSLVRRGDTRKLLRFRKKTKEKDFFRERALARSLKEQHLMAA